MSKEELILVGGGGHCRSCIDVIEVAKYFDIAGIVDMSDQVGKQVLGYEIIANDEEIPALAQQYQHFLVTLGSIKDVSRRVAIFDRLKQLGVTLPTIISPLGYVAQSAVIGEGSIVLHHALINAKVRVGKNCIINTKSLIEHDATVGDHCHISTGSIINGTSQIGHRVFLGSNSVVANDVVIVDDVIIGAGSVVCNSIEEAGLYVGNPARKVNKKG